MQRRSRCVLFVLLAAALADHGARADEASTANAVVLHWDAPAACPSEAEFLAQVEDVLGTPLAAQRAPGTIDVVASAGEGRWRVRITTHTADGDAERLVDGATCASVTAAAAIVVALALRPANDATPYHAPLDARADARPDAAAGGPPMVAAPVVTAPDRGQRSMSVSFHVSTGFEVGTVPGGAPSAGLGFVLGWGAVAGAVDVSWLRQQRVTVAMDDAIGADIRLWTASLRGCVRGRWLAELVALAVCLGAEGGELSGQGFGVPDARAASTLWLAGSAGGEARWHAGGLWFVSARIDAIVPFARPRFTLGAADELFTPAAIGGRGLVALELEIP